MSFKPKGGKEGPPGPPGEPGEPGAPGEPGENGLSCGGLIDADGTVLLSVGNESFSCEKTAAGVYKIELNGNPFVPVAAAVNGGGAANLRIVAQEDSSGGPGTTWVIRTCSVGTGNPADGKWSFVAAL